MADLQKLLDDERFQTAPQPQQAAILGLFFDDRAKGFPDVATIDPSQLKQVRDTFIQHNLPDPKKYLLGGANATIDRNWQPDAAEPIIRPRLPMDEGTISEAPPTLTDTVKKVATKLAVLPLVAPALPAAMIKNEISDFNQRGQILEGEGHPRSTGEAMAEAALRTAFLGGVVDNYNKKRTLGRTLHDVFDVVTSMAGMEGLAASGKALGAAKVLDNVIEAAPKLGLGAEEMGLLDQIKTKFGMAPEVSQGLKDILPPTAGGPVPLPEGIPNRPPVVPSPNPIYDAPVSDDIGTFNFDKIIDPDARQLLNTLAQDPETRKKFFAAKRGVISDEDLNDLAQAVKLAPKDILAIKEGTIFNAEQIHKAKQVLAGAGAAAVPIRDKFQMALEAKDPALEGQAISDAQQILQPLLDMMVKVRAVSSEQGRALRANKLFVNSLSDVGQALRELAMEQGDPLTPERTRQILQKLVKAKTSDPTDLSNILVQQLRPTVMDKAVTILSAMKLTNPMTFVRNFVGNVLGIAHVAPERALAGGADALRSIVTGKPQERFVGEAKNSLYGQLTAIPDAWKEAMQAWRNRGMGAQGRDLNARGPAFEGKFGKFINTPFSILDVTDNFFKTMLRRGELYARSYRQAAQEGLSGDALVDRAKEIAANPPKAWFKNTIGGEPNPDEVEKMVKEYTYQSDLGSLGTKVGKLREELGGLPKVLLPFYKTPLNIAKFIVQRSPLGVMAPRNVSAVTKLFKEGAVAGDAGRAADALARVSLGSSLFAAFFGMGLKGFITGAPPTDKAERDRLYRTGWRPYSFKLPGGYKPIMSFTGFEPVATPLSVAADLAQDYQKSGSVNSDMIGKMAWSIGQSFKSQPFLQSIDDLFTAFENPNSFSKWVDLTSAGTVVPSGVGMIARQIDPTIRNPKGVLQTIQSRLPFLSKGVPPKLNVFGEPIERGAEPSPDDAELNKEANVLGDEGFNIGFRGNRINNRTLTPEEHQQFQATAGPEIKSKLKELISSDGYSDLPIPQKKRLWKQIEDQVGERAAKDMGADVELRALGVPDLKSMGLPDDLVQQIRDELKFAIRGQDYRDLKDPAKVEYVKQRIRDVLESYQPAEEAAPAVR